MQTFVESVINGNIMTILNHRLTLKEEIIMVKLIAGKKGTGKSKKLIKMANEEVKAASGNVIYIDDDKRHMYDLDHSLRFINMEDYPVETPNEFFGFLCGLISNDYDIETIYIDGIMNVMDAKVEEIPKWTDRVRAIGEEHDIKFYLTWSYAIDELPAEFDDILMND